MTNTRATWNNKADFILALFSYGVGLGNVWRLVNLFFEEKLNLSFSRHYSFYILVFLI